MVAYQGDVTFEHAGSGGMGRMLKKAVTGEGTSLMKMTGSGEVFLADQAQDIHLIYLENDTITVNGPNLLAFDAGIDWDIQRVEGGAAAMMARRPVQHGAARHRLGGDPLRRPARAAQRRAAPTFADAQAAITWSLGVTTGIKTDFKMKNLIGRGSGEIDPDGVLRPGLGAGAAVRGPRRRRHAAARPAAAGSGNLLNG